jgi:hypothetical protein
MRRYLAAGLVSLALVSGQAIAADDSASDALGLTDMEIGAAFTAAMAGLVAAVIATHDFGTRPASP